MTAPVLEDLAFYTLAGQPASSRDLVAEVVEAEALGLGTAFISERYNKKEAATLSGAAGAVSNRIKISTAATNHNTRHPMVTAGYARTMQSLTGGRFTLGLGRGIPMMQDAFGIPRITTAQIEDFAGIMRRLFRGEVIVGHDGPAGSWPVLHLDATLDEHLPMGLVAFGPNSLALGGRCFDEVVLHTFFTDETTARCVQTVKQAAEKAGRDPASVKVWSCFATVGDHIPEDKRLMKLVGPARHVPPGLRRSARADQRLGPRRAEADPRRPDRVERPRARHRRHHRAARARGHAHPRRVARPGGHRQPAPVRRRHPQPVRLGCDGVIMHGATPAELAPIVAEYRRTVT